MIVLAVAAMICIESKCERLSCSIDYTAAPHEGFPELIVAVGSRKFFKSTIRDQVGRMIPFMWIIIIADTRAGWLFRINVRVTVLAMFEVM